MIGVDIVEIHRIKHMVDTYGDRFIKRIFTDREILYCNYSQRLRYQRFAVRFAAKEALIKAIGEKAFPWTDVEIVKGEEGRPDFELFGKAALFANQQGIVDIYVSLSHTATNAVASVYVISDEAYYENGDVQVFFKDEQNSDDEDDDEDDEDGAA